MIRDPGILIHIILQNALLNFLFIQNYTRYSYMNQRFLKNCIERLQISASSDRVCHIGYNITILERPLIKGTVTALCYDIIILYCYVCTYILQYKTFLALSSIKLLHSHYVVYFVHLWNSIVEPLAMRYNIRGHNTTTSSLKQNRSATA